MFFDLARSNPCYIYTQPTPLNFLDWPFDVVAPRNALVPPDVDLEEFILSVAPEWIDSSLQQLLSLDPLGPHHAVFIALSETDYRITIHRNEDEGCLEHGIVTLILSGPRRGRNLIAKVAFKMDGTQYPGMLLRAALGGAATLRKVVFLNSLSGFDSNNRCFEIRWWDDSGEEVGVYVQIDEEDKLTVC